MRKMTPSILIGLLLSGPSLAQDRGKMQFTNEELVGLCEQNDSEEVIEWAGFLRFFNPRRSAQALVSGSLVVVDGEFYAIPEADEEELETLDRKDLMLNFRVMKVYNGWAPESIKIKANSDMLVFPGKNTSRYVERLKIIESQRAQFRPLWEREVALEALLKTGEISQETFEAKQLGLFELAEEVARDHKVTDLTEVGAIDAETFYEMGGLIRENERYVFGFPVQPSGDNTYEIEVAGGYMYFGERREDVVGWLEAPEDYQPVSPFRGYDPTNEQDCARLRELVGPVEPALASDIAKDLLDNHQFVAYGEFVEFPEATQEELRTLIPVEDRLMFRVHSLYKGELTGMVELTVNSDMLLVPGKGVSRYEVRGEILKEVKLRSTPHVERLAQIERSLEAGELDYKAAREEMHRIGNLRHQIFLETGLLSGRRVYSFLGDSFYDRGGVIKPFHGFLIGVNEKTEYFGGYRLHDTPDQPSRIYWGSQSDNLRRELEHLASRTEDRDSSME